MCALTSLYIIVINIRLDAQEPIMQVSMLEYRPSPIGLIMKFVGGVTIHQIIARLSWNSRRYSQQQHHPRHQQRQSTNLRRL